MDSERRHELETNDLREFLDNFKDFWDKHGNRMLITLIVVLGAWLAYAKYNEWQMKKAQAAYSELNDAESADAFRTLAGERGQIHDEAMRRGGDAALGQARSTLIENDAEGAEKLLKKANSAYAALTEKGATTEYKLVGHEGLAKVAIMREQWDKAANHYAQLIELAGETFAIQADRAQRALDRIDLLKNPVAFAPEIEVEPAPAPVEPKPDSPPPLPLPLPTPPAE